MEERPRRKRKVTNRMDDYIKQKAKRKPPIPRSGLAKSKRSSSPTMNESWEKYGLKNMDEITASSSQETVYEEVKSGSGKFPTDEVYQDAASKVKTVQTDGAASISNHHHLDSCLGAPGDDDMDDGDDQFLLSASIELENSVNRGRDEVVSDSEDDEPLIKRRITSVDTAEDDQDSSAVLSPKSLKRGFVIQQVGPGSRNPPLTKSRHSPAASLIPEPLASADQPDTLPDPEQRMKGRGGRFDRPVDSRRYHTAGTIEDLKKQDSKDSSIHKRLSWNQQPGTIPGNDLQQKTKTSKCLSTDSVQSSSGVSSTGSLHLSIGSEFDPVVTGGHGAPGAGVTPASVVTIGVPAPAPPSSTPPIPPRGNHHVSTTYITQDSVIIRGPNQGPGESSLAKTKMLPPQTGKTQGMSGPKGEPGKERPYRTLDKGGPAGQKVVSEQNSCNPEITINLPETKESVSPINISISSNQNQQPDSEILKLRDILLKDSSVEAS